jgi:hypothetical protein
MNTVWFTDTGLESRAQLVNSFLSPLSGIEIDSESVQVSYGTYTQYDPVTFVGTTGSSIAYYNSSESIALPISNGVILSSGSTTPPLYNSMSSYTTNLTYSNGLIETDTDLGNVAQAAFSGSGTIYDASWVEFDFTVTDPYNTHGISFNILFGSEEYPEYSNSSYVDIAGVFLNGVNVALFNGNATNPLSVIQSNIDLGYFINNSASILPIEYDGVSNLLSVYAPLQPGTNTIKIGVADTGDSSYDSSLIVANMRATQLGGGGLGNITYGDDGNDDMVGTANNEIFDLGAGDDTIDPGAGDDIVLTGAGDDLIYGGNGDNQIDGGEGIDTVIYEILSQAEAYVKVMDNDTIHVGENSDTLLNIETIQFSDGSYNTQQLLVEDDVAKIYVAYFGRAADPLGMQYWVSDISYYLNHSYNYYDSIKNVIDSFAKSAEAEVIYPGMNTGDLTEAGLSAFITSVYNNLFDRAPDAPGLAYWLPEAATLQEEGKAVGNIIKTIIDGALDTQVSLDRTMIQNKAQVSWDYAKQYELHALAWNQETMSDQAKALIDAITSDGATVNAAYAQILGIVEGTPLLESLSKRQRHERFDSKSLISWRVHFSLPLLLR